MIQFLHRVDDISGLLRNDRLLRILARVENAGRPSPHSARRGMLLGVGVMREPRGEILKGRRADSGFACVWQFSDTMPEHFRRSLISHYVSGEAGQVIRYSHPVSHMDGTVADLKINPGDGSCEVWVEENGEPAIELCGTFSSAYRGGRMNSGTEEGFEAQKCNV